MVGSLLTKVFGSRNERLIKQMWKTVDRVNTLEPEMQALSDEAVAASAEASYWSARAYERLGRNEQALAALERALTQAPAPELSARIHVERGNLLFDAGRNDEATAAYQSAGGDYALHAAAVAQLNQGNAQDAVELARQVLQNADSPYRAEARLTLAEGLFATGEHRAAQAEFERVLSDDSDAARRARALSRMGWCAYLTDDFAAAQGHFERVVSDFGQASEARESQFMAARSAEAGGATDAAREHYAEYLERYDSAPRREEALLRAARLSDGADGVSLLRTLLREAPAGEYTDQAHFDLAERLAAAGALEAASEQYVRVVEDHGESPLLSGARYGLAWCAYDQGDFERARRSLSALLEQDEVERELRLSGLELMVWTQQRLGDGPRANAAYVAFADLCDDEPRRLRAARVAARAMKETGLLAEAAKLFGDLLRKTHDKDVAVQICVERAYLALDQNQGGAARRELDTAHRYAPQHPALTEAYYFVGESFFKEGADDDAAQLFEVAATSQSQEVAERALYKGGFARLRSGDFAGSARCFEALVRDHSGSELFGESLFLLGESRFRAGEFAAAVEPLRRVVNEVPKHDVIPKALFRLGVALARTQEWRAASEALADLARRAPEFANLAEAELWRGRALAQLSQARGARQAFDRVLELDRGVLSARAHLELGKLALSAGDDDAALSDFLKVAVLYAHEEEVAEALFRAGAVLERQDKRDNALAQYAEASSKYEATEYGQKAAERLRELQR